MDDDPEPSAQPSREPSQLTFGPPSLHPGPLLAATSYTHYSPLPAALLPPPTASDPAPACALGIDEAGRGPVLGPMVYAAFYLPAADEDALLRADAHRFDDSKRLTPAVRSALMRTLCDRGSALHGACGWAVSVLSARDIAAGMLDVGGGNLNAQAVDATVELIRGVYARGVNVRDIYVDTIGQPAPYQARLQRIFPTARITVAKKADSLYPCVSAASVCAKVTRDAALEALWHARRPGTSPASVPDGDGEVMAWGSGYPSDARCVAWMRRTMHPVFGWGAECRFSWGTAKDMLETKGAVKVDWPEEEEDEMSRMTDYFATDARRHADAKERNELATWFGTPVGLEAF